VNLPNVTANQAPVDDGRAKVGAAEAPASIKLDGPAMQWTHRLLR
jgi:hypothetical protein